MRHTLRILSAAIVAVTLTVGAAAAHEKPAAAGVLAIDLYSQGETLDFLEAVVAGEGVELRHRRSTDGGRTWTPAVPIDTGSAGIHRPYRGSEPQVAALDDRLVAMWTAPGTSEWGSGPLATATSSDGGRTWRPGPAPVDNGSHIAHGYVELVVDGGGRFHAVWLDGRSGRQALHTALSRDGGATWEKNRTIDDGACTCCWNRAISMTADSVHVIYRDDTPRDLAVAVTNDGGDHWSRLGRAGAFDWEFDGCPGVGGALALTREEDQSSLHALAWTGTEGKAGLYVMTSKDLGRTWSEPSSFGGAGAHKGDFAAAGATLAAAWDVLGERGRSVVAAVSRDAGRSWSEPLRLSEPGVNATQPLVAEAADGFLAVWTERADGGEEVTWKMRRFRDARSR